MTQASALLFVIIAIVGPGVGAQRWLRLRVDPALVLPLGTVQVAGAYLLSQVLGIQWLLPSWVLLSSLGLVRRGVELVTDRPPLRAVVPPALAVVVVIALTQMGGNRPGPDGSFLLDPMGDQPLHAGLAWELTLPFPPQVPGLAGVPLSYHYGADLVRAAAVHWSRAQPYELLNGLEPVLGATGLLLVLAGLTCRLGGPRLAVQLAAWSILATDLSFLPGLVWGGAWWSDAFRGNVLISLVFANPVIPALTIALGSVAAFSRYEAGEGHRWLWLAVGQAVAVPYFKVFLGAQLGFALGLASVVLWKRTRFGASEVVALPWKATLAMALATAPGLVALTSGTAGEQVRIAVAPLQLVRLSLEGLGLTRATPTMVLALVVPWLVVSLGLRIAGLPLALRAALGSRSAPATLGFLALSGWPLGLVFHAAALDIDGRELPSATIYFVEQSGAVLWVFAAVAIAGLSARVRSRGLVLFAVAMLTLPSTAEFIHRKAREPLDPVPAAYVRALSAIERDGRPGDCVLQRPIARYPPLPVVLSGRRVVFERFTPYLTQFAPRAELERRHEALHRFFRTSDRAEARAIAVSFGARYLCLYGPDRIRFDGTGILVPLHEEAEARSYRLDWPETATEVDPKVEGP